MRLGFYGINSEKPSQLKLNVEGEDFYEAMELSPQRNVKREYDTDFRVDYKLRKH